MSGPFGITERRYNRGAFGTANARDLLPRLQWDRCVTCGHCMVVERAPTCEIISACPSCQTPKHRR